MLTGTFISGFITPHGSFNEHGTIPEYLSAVGSNRSVSVTPLVSVRTWKGASVTLAFPRGRVTKGVLIDSEETFVVGGTVSSKGDTFVTAVVRWDVDSTVKAGTFTSPNKRRGYFGHTEGNRAKLGLALLVVITRAADFPLDL